MAKWSQLPKELLDLIAQRLKTTFDILRFRSVCSSWRSSVPPPPKPRCLPYRFPSPPDDVIPDMAGDIFLSKRTIFHLGFPENPRENPTTPSPSDPNGWLIKIEEDNRERMHLLNPLSIYEFKSLPATFPKVLDLSKFRVSELGQEYVLQCTIFRPDPWGNTVESQTEKVVICPEMCPSSGSSDGFVLLMILAPNDLVIFASRERKGAIIEDMPSPDDVILFNGKFYAVDSTGRTVMVELPSNATVVADSVFGGSKKYLVESRGELLLVDMYKSLDPNELLDQLDDFKVFKLDEKGQKWVEVKSLGDRVLFLGSHSTFSASASDFPGCKGNCIYFTHNSLYLRGEEDPALKYDGIGIFDLENGSIEPSSNLPGFFWPPPSWVVT